MYDIEALLTECGNTRFGKALRFMDVLGDWGEL